MTCENVLNELKECFEYIKKTFITSISKMSSLKTECKLINPGYFTYSHLNQTQRSKSVENQIRTLMIAALLLHRSWL